MSRMTPRLLAAAAVVGALATASALAQQPQTVRVRGPIEAVDGSTLTVKAGGGGHGAEKLDDQPPGLRVLNDQVRELNAGGFIGGRWPPQARGSQARSRG